MLAAIVVGLCVWRSGPTPVLDLRVKGWGVLESFCMLQLSARSDGSLCLLPWVFPPDPV
jgi:hypothetical protein